MTERHDRDTILIRDKRVLHSTARRDWRCATCGSTLTTRWFDDGPHWRTVCASDETHDPDSFVHQTTWAYLEHKRMVSIAQADDVFAHLPPELQAAILAS